MKLERALARMLDGADNDDAGIFNDIAIDATAAWPAARAMLEQPEGRAMSALIEAAVAWHAARMWAAAQDPWPHDEADERIESAEESAMAAVDAWLALGDET